ncbi:MAG TPA: carbon storage regulator [Pirellulales bacterium]|jgi:carbon storage regulator CsrA|nr:carbon storage regulator [Pirellulales bacterium]
MLVLSRKVNEQILIGDAIKITILRVRGDAIRVGIEAPREVQVRRSELPPLPQSPAAPRPQRPRPRRHGEKNPGERASAVGSRPLAAKLHARRVPSASTTPLMT